MNAAANAGLIKGMTELGEGIAAGVEKYKKNKEESALLDGQAPALAGAVQRMAEGIKDEAGIARFKKYQADIAAMPTMSLAKKRAVASGIMAESSLYDKGQEQQMRQNQINAYNQNVANQQAYTQSLGGPTTRDVQRLENTSNLQDYSQFVNAPNQQLVQPDRTNFNLGLYGKDERQGTAMPLGASNAQDQQAQPEFMNSLAAIQANRPQPSAAPIAQPQAAQVNPSAFAQQAPRPAAWLDDPSTTINRLSRWATQTRQYPEGVDYFAPGGTDFGPPQYQAAQQAPAAAPTRAPVMAAHSQTPVGAPVAAQRNLPSASQFDQSFNQNIDRVGQTSERTVTDKVDLTPKELYTNQLASYIAKGGQVTPELNAQFKKDAGVKAAVDVKVQNINGITVITQDGDVKHVLPPVVEKGATPGDLLTAQRDFESRFVKVGNRSFQAPTSQEGIKMRTTIKDHDVIGSGLTQLISLADDPTVKIKFPPSDAYNKAKTISTMLQGALRTTITGPGAVNESEYKMLRDVIADPSRFFSLSSANKKVLQTLLSRVDDNLNAEIKSLGGVDVTGASIGSVNNSGFDQGTRYYSTTGNQKK